MATWIHHAHSSVRHWGGRWEDYAPIHKFMDSSKDSMGDFRHRALYHHTEGVALVERVFGPELTLHRPDGTTKTIPTRWVAEQHLLEDFGRMPTAADWLRCLHGEPWMSNAARGERDLLTKE